VWDGGRRYNMLQCEKSNGAMMRRWEIKVIYQKSVWIQKSSPPFSSNFLDLSKEAKKKANKGTQKDKGPTNKQKMTLFLVHKKMIALPENDECPRWLALDIFSQDVHHALVCPSLGSFFQWILPFCADPGLGETTNTISHHWCDLFSRLECSIISQLALSNCWPRLRNHPGLPRW